jgi:4-alpha-glucanotransferase
MNSPELMRAAHDRGVATSYRASGGREVTVAPATIEAILAALGDPPASRPVSGPEQTARADAVAPAPAQRSWGLTVQLYAVRSAASWGHGDFRDLADLAALSAREFGAGFVLINPLHAAEPVPPISPSPYLPMSRQFISPLYLRIEDIPEYAALDERERGHLTALAKPLRATSQAGELIDRDAVWAAKRAALKILHQVPLSAAREADYDRYREEAGDELRDWATWCVLAETRGPDWREWPAVLARPGSDMVAAELSRMSREADFHTWLQWLASGQLAAAQAAALEAGMGIGIIQDLAVGTSPAGADVWAQRELYVPGVSVGAPPDEFNQLGQDWGSQPWHPERLAEQDYRALAGLVNAATRSGGALRMDHVMGLFRLWWVPPGLTPDQGTYVSYDHVATVGTLARAAADHGFLVIGEDLGTIEPWIREYLAGHGVLGTSMLWFERDDDGAPLPPSQWRPASLATVGTHDIPPAAAFVTGAHVALRAGLDVLARSEEAERADHEQTMAAWREALVREGLLPADGSATVAEQVVALYAYLARTPSALIGVSLPDAVGQRAPQNIPGTVDEYPNWRIPLTDGDGRPVLLEDLAGHPGLRAIAAAVGGTAELSAELNH